MVRSASTFALVFLFLSCARPALGTPAEPVPAPAEALALELVFDGDSPHEFAAWLRSRQNSFPELRPVRIILDSSSRQDTIRSFYVSFYDEEGIAQAHRTYSGLCRPHWYPGGGRWFNLSISPRADRLLISDHLDVWSSKDIVATVIGPDEDTVFVSHGGMVWHRDADYFIRGYYDEEGWQEREYCETLDPRGRVAARVTLAGHPGPLRVASDGTCLFAAGDDVVALDPKGNVLWREELPGMCEVGISADGRRAAALTLDRMKVKDLLTGRVFDESLPQGGRQRYAKPDIAFAGPDAGWMLHRPAATMTDTGGVVRFYDGEGLPVGAPLEGVKGVLRAMHYDGNLGTLAFSGNVLLVAGPDSPPRVFEHVGLPDGEVVMGNRTVAFVGTRRAMVYRVHGGPPPRP